MENLELITVASFDNAAIAHIAKSKLEAEGIRCFLDGEHHVSMDWLISNAVGGIKLVVGQEDKDRALEILEQDRSELFENAHQTNQDEQTGPVECPACKSTEIHDERFQNKTGFWSILFFGFPFSLKSRVIKCTDCGLRWLPD